MAPRLGLSLVLSLTLAWWFSGAVDAQPGTVHTVVNVDCGAYFGFQTLGLLHSLKKAGQPGPVTRIMSCEPEEVDELDEETLGLVQTFITPPLSTDEETGDNYPPINRPKSLVMWLDEMDPPEEWLLVLDPDMLVRSPLTPSTLDIPEGFASAAHCDYLKGCNDDLAERHIPEVPKMFDGNGGERGRKCDQVGTYYLIRTEDMKRVAPLWSQYSYDVRHDLEALEYEKEDGGNKGGQKPWIAEMYGYAFATAKLGIRHIASVGVQSYTFQNPGGGYVVDTPKVIHYTLDLELPGYIFAKRNHTEFNHTKCPSDDFQLGNEYGLFPHPPHPSRLDEEDPNIRYLQLLGLELVGLLNEALCDRHQRECPHSAALAKECKKVEELQNAVMAEEVLVEKSGDLCAPFFGCGFLKMWGMCETRRVFMGDFCRTTCGLCMHGHQKESIMGEALQDGDDGGEHMPDEVESMLQIEHSSINRVGGGHMWWLVPLPFVVILLILAKDMRCSLLWPNKRKLDFSAFQNRDLHVNDEQQKIKSIWKLSRLSRKQS